MAFTATLICIIFTTYRKQHLCIVLRYRREAQRQRDIADAHSVPECPDGGPDEFCPETVRTLADVPKIITDSKPLDRCDALFADDLQAQAKVTGMCMV
jgi:hypothetical protein